MKELFTRSFWKGVQGTYQEALESPEPHQADAYTQIAMNIGHFKHLLQAKERELLADIARLEEEARASGEAQVRDSTDEATSSQGTSESLQEETAASQTLIQVQDALQRIDNGAYGKCMACGKQIPAARLEAVPWAAYCLEDQEKEDRAAHVPKGRPTL
jgi:RNA polymerase-binding protein DksA